MRISVTALALLFADTRAFLPVLPSRLTLKSKNEEHLMLRATAATTTTCPTPQVTSTTPILADSDQMTNIMEARRCVIEIDLAADRARDYLTHLDEQQQVLFEFVENSSTPLPNHDIHLPLLQTDQDVSLYQDYIQEQTDAAVSYLDYLVDLRRDILPYITMYEQELQAGIVTYTRHAPFLQDLEETVVAAKAYLGYLKDVSNMAQHYLSNPQLKGIQQYLPQEQQQAAAGLLSIQDFIQKEPTDLERYETSTQEAFQRDNSWSKSNMVDSTAMAMAMQVTPSNELPAVLSTASESPNDETYIVEEIRSGHLDNNRVPVDPVDWTQFKAPTTTNEPQEDVAIPSSHEASQPATLTATDETPYKESFSLEESPPMELHQEETQREPLEGSWFQTNEMNSRPDSAVDTLQTDTASPTYDSSVDDVFIVEETPCVNSYVDQPLEHTEESPIDWSQFNAPQKPDGPDETSDAQGQVLDETQSFDAVDVSLINEHEFIVEETPSMNLHNEQNDWSDYQTVQTIESTEPLSISSTELDTEYSNTAAKVKKLLNGKDTFLQEQVPSVPVEHKELRVPEPIDWSQFKAEHSFEPEVADTDVQSRFVPSSIQQIKDSNKDLMEEPIHWSQFKAPQENDEPVASDSVNHPDMTHSSHTTSSTAYMEDFAKSLSSMADSSIEDGAPTPSFENVATFENRLALDGTSDSSSPVQSVPRLDVNTDEAPSSSLYDAIVTSPTEEIDSNRDTDDTHLDNLASASYTRPSPPKNKSLLDMNDISSRVPVLGGARLHWAVSFDSMDEPQGEFSLLKPDATISAPSSTTTAGAFQYLYSDPNDVVSHILALEGAELHWAVQFSSRRDPTSSFSLQMPEPATKPRHPLKKSKKARKSPLVDMNDVVSYIPTLGGAMLNWAIQFWPREEEPQADDDWLPIAPDAAIPQLDAVEMTSSASGSSSETTQQEQPYQQESNLSLGKSHRAKKMRRRLFVSKKKLRQRLRLISTSYFWKTKRQLEKEKAPTWNELPVGVHNRTFV